MQSFGTSVKARSVCLLLGPWAVFICFFADISAAVCTRSQKKGANNVEPLQATPIRQ